MNEPKVYALLYAFGPLVQAPKKHKDDLPHPIGVILGKETCRIVVKIPRQAAANNSSWEEKYL